MTTQTPHGNTANTNAKKANLMTASLSFRIPPELKQSLTARSEDGDANKQARRDLLELYGINI